MNFIITLTGPSCGGKSTLENSLEGNKIGKKVISFTTRTIRDGEADGVDYYFISKDEANRLIEEKQAVQYVMFGEHIYGSTQAEFDRIYAETNVAIVVVEPTGVTQFAKYAEDRGDCFLIRYFVTNTTQKLVERMLLRYGCNVAENKTTIFAKRIEHLLKVEVWWGRDTEFYSIFILNTIEEKQEACKEVNSHIERLICAFK